MSQARSRALSCVGTAAELEGHPLLRPERPTQSDSLGPHETDPEPGRCWFGGGRRPATWPGREARVRGCRAEAAREEGSVSAPPASATRGGALGRRGAARRRKRAASTFTASHRSRRHKSALQFAGTVAGSSKLASASISMASVSNSISIGLPSYGLYAETRFISQSYRKFPRRSSYKYLRIRAVQGNDGRRSLVDIIRIIPELSSNYFRSRSRRALFGGIALLGGFYVAQTISLSFGALGVNDVIAAVVCVLLAEYVTKFYYSRPKVTFPVALLNNFKMGFTYGLFIDAFKLAS